MEQVRRVVTNPAAVLVLAVVEGEIIGTLLGAFDGWGGNITAWSYIRAAGVKESDDN